MRNNQSHLFDKVRYAFEEMYAQAEWGGKEDYEGETQELYDMFYNAFDKLKEYYQ